MYRQRVSEINDVYVYFSMTEKELLRLTRAGGTLKEQLEKMPATGLSPYRKINSDLRLPKMLLPEPGLPWQT